MVSRRRASFVLVGVVAVSVSVACGTSPKGVGPVSVSIAPSILVPQGILDGAQTLDLTVYSTAAGVSCDAATGEASGVTSSTSKVATASLGTANCAAGAKFCGSLTITQSATPMVFSAQAFDANSNVLAYGCATATVNQDTLAVSITMQRFIPPATCGNDVIETGEQCEPPTLEGGTDLVCDSECHSKEETLSTGATSPEGPASFLWPPQSGTGGELMAFFAENTGNLDVALRVMSDALEGVTVPTAAASAIIAPNDGQPNGTCTFPPVSAPGDQNEPSAALLGGTYYYAFEDTLDIHMRSFDASLCAQQPIGAPIGINGAGGAGEPGTQDSPSLAANVSGLLLIAWRDQTSQQIFARTYDPAADGGSPLGTQNQISSASGNNENVQVAPTPTGWIVVWDDGTQILMRAVSTTGTPNGPAVAVSGATHTGTQDHPGVATLGDGRAAVVWCDHGTSQGADVFLQRYDATLTAVPGDQTTAINNLVTAGDQVTPAIAGSAAQGGSFVAAWLDGASGQVRGRVLGGSSGFLFNAIDGQTDEFQASIAAGVTRENPTVAIGGAGPWVAIGWDDGTAIYARRFPTSTE